VTDLDAEIAAPHPERAETVRRDIVVIGASAGGVETLRTIVPHLPEDLAAAVLVVLHLAPGAPSSLSAILARRTPMLTATAQDGDTIEPGRIYVARPDRHMLVEEGQVRLSRGPRENGCRPAIDPLFRTAARHYGSRVIGVVLTGNLSDGSVGLKAVDDHGGVTIVQDPDDALHPGMPGSAIEEVEPHYVLPAAEIADLIVQLSEQPAPLPLTAVEAAEESTHRKLANMSCPECGGPLSELREGRTPSYACRVGHTFSTGSLFSQQADALESALWTAIRVLQERQDLALRLAEQLERRGADLAAQRFRRNAEETRQHSGALRRLVEDFDASADAGPREAEVASAARSRTARKR
jgi:two-component system, chemotaxis family, protein-glutamate methylesterase/glutaminase